MHNPWLDLSNIPPFVLPSDRAIIDRFNSTASSKKTIHLNCLPEPFLGHPDAPVVLLNLNPGFTPEDVHFHLEDEAFITRSWANLHHETEEYGFYLLDPVVEKSPGYGWWTRRLQHPIEACGQRTVANNVLCVEFFPYHSSQFGFRKRVSSQTYSFHLVRQAMQRNALIVQIRSRRLWFEVVPELNGYPHWCELNSKQSAYVSPRNCPMYEQVVKHIRTG